MTEEFIAFSHAYPG